MMNAIAGCQPNAVRPSRSCCVCSPRISEKVMLQVQSSIGASVMVAVTTTPLEVVKTRLQIGPAIFDQKANRHLFSKCLSSSGKEGHRISTMKVFSLDSSYHHRPGPFNVLKTILQTKGISGLWTGTGSAIIHAVPSVSIYLVCYEQLKAKFEEIETPNALTPVLAGALSRSISVLITVFAELSCLNFVRPAHVPFVVSLHLIWCGPVRWLPIPSLQEMLAHSPGRWPREKWVQYP
jgi:hypothetical protein